MLLPGKNQNVKATGESSSLPQSVLLNSPQDALLAEDDLPGFRQAGESEGIGYLTFAKRLTSGLFGLPAGITNVSTFQIKDPFRSEYVISFLAYPISEKDALSFDALTNNPQSILAVLANSSQTSGIYVDPSIIPGLGDIADKSMGFTLAMGQEPVAQNIDFFWARRGTIIQSIWVIYPVGDKPSTDLHQLGLLVDQRVTERFPGITFRPAGLLVPEITTQIPTPLDISTRPSVIGTNLLLAALMMLPFTLAAEIFTEMSAEREAILRDKFWLTRWLLSIPRWFEKHAGTLIKKQATGATSLRLVLIMVFYGLAFSLLDRNWNPLSVTGLVLFLNMTVAYGVVGIADDIMQWRTLKKWGKPAEINLRPTNILIAATSVTTSRLLSIVPGLMFGTPEALIIDEAHLGRKRRNYLLKISAITLLGIGFGLWALTTITSFVLRQNITDTLRNVVGGAEGFLLIVFAVALENTFVQMLGLPGSFGEAIRKKNRWLWVLGLVGITFAFYHTLINPRGELSAALQESNVRIFLAVTGLFVILTFSLWAYIKINERQSAGIQHNGKENSRKGKHRRMIPAWVWLAVTMVVGTVIGDILITRHTQQAILANISSTPSVDQTVPPASPAPAAEGSSEIQLAFIVPGALEKLCFLPAVNVTKNPADSYTWRAVQLSASQFGALPETLAPVTPDDAGYTTAIAQFIRDGCDLIVGNYDPQGQAIMKMAAGNPDQNFMLVAGGSDLPNVWVTKYSLPEQAYLAGYLAAAATRSGKVGTFGNLQIQDVVSSMNCFALGVSDYNKAQQANVTVLGWDGKTMQGFFTDGLMDINQGIKLTNDLISQGADVVFPLAGSGVGSTGSGTIIAAGQHAGVYVIGVDLDWAWAVPEFSLGIISSVQTRYEQSIALAADALARGEFHGGVHKGTLASGEISLSPLRTKFSSLISENGNDQLVHQSIPAVMDKEISACQIQPRIGGFLNMTAVDGSNWPANTGLTIHVYSSPGGPLLFTGQVTTDRFGSFFQSIGVTLVPGMNVEGSVGAETASTIIVPMTIDVIDPEGDIISGTAPAGAQLSINIGDVENGTKADLPVTTNANGQWLANFSGQFDITSKTVVQATVLDANYSGTIIKISLDERK